jgi:hypothetical protein
MRKILLALVSTFSLAVIAGCGGGSSGTVAPPNPSGGNNAGFSNASLNGNYVFSAHGLTGNNVFAVAGTFTADGAGNITTGVRDTVNDRGGQSIGEGITGSYGVNQDGRGQMILNGASGQVIYRFVLQSPTAGTLFQISNANDATGRIQQQSGSPAASGTYIVRLDGEDSTRSVYGAIGGLTASGTNLSGQIDENDAGIVNQQLAASGTIGFGGTNGRGTAFYTTPASTATTSVSSQGTHTFIVYYVSPSRLELISPDKTFFLHGFADLQTSVAGTVGAFTGNQVFNISGFDSNGFPIIETGRFTLDGAGNVTNGIEDFNDAANFFSAVPFNGSYTVAPNGRWQTNFTFTSSTLGFIGWQVSPQQSTVLTNSPNVLETGTMRAQTGGLTNASITGNYAQSLSGFNNAGLGNAELTGNLLANGAGSLSGTFDSQTDGGGVTTDAPQTGTYTVDPVFGRGSAFIDGLPVQIYTVDPNTVYMISTSASLLYQGMLLAQ